MLFRKFGRLGWDVSEVGYGMWGMGGWTGSDDAESLQALERSVQLGCNFFDTAWVYGLGKSEALLGQLLASHPDRELIVATKIPPKNMRWPALGSYAVADVYPLEHVREYTRKSLGNLGVDQIDLQQFHVWSDAWAPDAAWQRGVRDLKESGMVRAFGISVNRGEPANVLRALDTGLIDSVQVVYNIFEQAPEDALFPYCEKHGIAIIARVPFDEGSLTGTLSAGSRWPEGDWRNVYFAAANLLPTLERVARLNPLVPDGMDLAEVALRFILENKAVSTVIPGMRRPRHVARNLGVSDGDALPRRLYDALRAHRWDRQPAGA